MGTWEGCRGGTRGGIMSDKTTFAQKLWVGLGWRGGECPKVNISYFDVFPKELYVGCCLSWY